MVVRREPSFRCQSLQRRRRDLAFVMDKAITCGQIEDCIRKENKYVKEIKLFDIYEGGQIPEGKKSMAFSITFVPKVRHLTMHAFRSSLTRSVQS